MRTSVNTEAGPQPDMPDYPDIHDYLVAWHTWRAIRRDWMPPKDAIDHKTRLLGAKLGLPPHLVESVIGR